jgi:hypothetical protein
MTKWRLDRGQIEVVDDDLAEVLRKKTPAERVAMIGDAHQTARLLLNAGIQRRHPDWDEAAVARAVARRLLGEPE